MADLSWLTTPIGSAAAAQPTVWGLNPQDWQNVTYALGNMGQGILKGTDKEWLAAPGAVAAGMAKNSQASAANKDFIETLKALAGHVNNPNVGGVDFKTNPDGGLSGSIKSNAFDPNAYINQIPSMINQQSSAQPTPTNPAQSVTQQTNTAPVTSAVQQLGPALAGGSSFFDPAQKPWLQERLT